MLDGDRFIAFITTVVFCVYGCIGSADAKEAKSALPVVRYLLEAGTHNKIQLTPLKLTKHGQIKSVTNCPDFIKNIDSWNVQEDINNMRVASDYQSCIVNAIIKLTEPSRKTSFHNDFPELIFHELDLSSFPSSLHNQTDSAKRSISALGMKKYKHSKTSVMFSPAGWHYQFDLLAKGDFNRDSDENLLVRFIDQSASGNYYAAEILVLSYSKKNAFWIAQEGTEFLRQRRNDTV